MTQQAAMKQRLRALVADDSEDDFALLVLTLVKSSYDVDAHRVDTAEDMRAALASRSWDIVFSDWSMPSFSAPAALAVLRETKVDVPFIIVSGTVGDEVAVTALRNGAHDFVAKDKLARLVPAVERELREAQTRRERNELREQLMISDRMVSVGILAAGIAHEINNPLAAVIANLELAAADVALLIQQHGESSLVVGLRDQLIDARAAADRVRTIVRDVKVFSRNEAEKRGPVDVRRVIESSLRMASNEIRHRARVVADYQDVPPVFASEARLGQVFLNLIVNAAQAIPEGKADQYEIRIKARVEEKRARIDIEDTGPGIPPEIMKRLFTPFVTTKPLGIGTGLGLSICRRIITEFGGEISVDSQVGVGTTFTVWIPLSTSDVGSREIPRMVGRRAIRRGSILVIDDEPLLAIALQRCLARDHDVTCLHRAREAIERVERGEHFDVILSDLMMPEITGMELHDELLKIAPEQAAAMVFLTGGAFTTHAREFLDRVPNQRLEKPFDSVELRSLISNLVK
jgi:signal transduction histidine kinase